MLIRSLKVHVVSAFALIGIIPFTRFMHFLVYPLDYTGETSAGYLELEPQTHTHFQEHILKGISQK
ncbi:MAG: respiratory nitrate reductase subunit gamma [Bacteroidia bacterium]